jgi:uncharacterized protein YjiS (DUF1127 family)
MWGFPLLKQRTSNTKGANQFRRRDVMTITLVDNVVPRGTAASLFICAIRSGNGCRLSTADHNGAVMRSTNESVTFFRNVETTPFVLKFVDVVASWVRSYLAWRQRHADIAFLQSLTTRELKDIGLCPGDLDFIANKLKGP